MTITEIEESHKNKSIKELESTRRRLRNEMNEIEVELDIVDKLIEEKETS